MLSMASGPRAAPDAIRACRGSIQPLAVALIVRPGPMPHWARLFPIVEKIETPSPRGGGLRPV